VRNLLLKHFTNPVCKRASIVDGLVDSAFHAQVLNKIHSFGAEVNQKQAMLHEYALSVSFCRLLCLTT
jgi:hypothetical protein